MKTGFYRKMIFENCRGSTPVIIICSTLFVILISAVLTDVGYYAVQRFKLERDAEAVVRYGAEELAKGSVNAEALTRKYAKKRASDLNKLDIRIPDNQREITVIVGKTFNYNFLKFAGLKEKDIEASSTARLSVVRALKGIRPFAVQEQNFTYGKLYTLSYGVYEEGMTPFLPVRLGDDNYEVNIVFGSRNKINVGDTITVFHKADKTETEKSIKSLLDKCRHEPACIYPDYEEECPRIIAVPVVDKLDANGAAMKVIGFAAFFIESSTVDKEYLLIKGRFIKHAVKADTTDNISNFGLTGIKMLD